MKYTTYLCATLMILSAFVATGCQRSRLLSRNDYADMNGDPFVQPDSTSVASANSRGTAGEGVVRMDGNPERTAALPAQRPVPGSVTALRGGPKPITTPNSTVRGRTEVPLARATYPGDEATAASQISSTRESWPGPELTDFLKDSTRSDSKTAALLPGRGNGQAGGELQDFAKFVDNSTPAATRSPKPQLPANNARQQTEPNLSEWIAEQQKVWETEKASAAGSAPSAATPPADGLRKSVFAASAGDSLRGLTTLQQDASQSDAFNDLKSDVIDLSQIANQESVSGQNPFSGLSSPDQTSAPPLATGSEVVKTPGPVVADDPFANPFAMGGSSDLDRDPWAPDSGQPRQMQQEASNDLDAAFRMDSGWKPSHLVTR